MNGLALGASGYHTVRPFATSRDLLSQILHTSGVPLRGVTPVVPFPAGPSGDSPGIPDGLSSANLEIDVHQPFPYSQRMNETTYTVLDDAKAAAVRDFPAATPCPALSAFLDYEVRFDAASATVIKISSFTSVGPSDTVREPDISLTTSPGVEWISDDDLADLLSDRVSEYGSNPERSALLQAVLAELADIHAASLPYRREGESVERSVASDLARREMMLKAQLASVRAVRAQVVRALVTDTGEQVSPETDRFKLAMEYSVEDFNELAALVAEHRRMLGELL